MQKIEKVFDVNSVLLVLYSSLESLIEERKIELIYEMDATIPKELRGDVDALNRILKKTATFVFEKTNKQEIILSLSAPEDFFYQEEISFKIKDTGIAKKELLGYLKENITQELARLEGKIIEDKDWDIYLKIPFLIGELAHRRHYRLPDIGMLGKKVLILSQSEKVMKSIKKMFEYFLYEVDTGFDAFKAVGNDLCHYDILVLDDTLASHEFDQAVAKLQKEAPFKYVLLRDSHIGDMRDSEAMVTHLIKPVTQESVFELIATLFHHTIEFEENRSEDKTCIVDLQSIVDKQHAFKEDRFVKNHVSHDNLSHLIQQKKELKLEILNTKLGEENAKKRGLKYTTELKDFLEIFNRSDIYFRQIAIEKSTTKIKAFCSDLEKRAKVIGAESMLRFADIVSLIFVYDKLDMLVIYPGRYHIELKNLTEAIKKYLDNK
ncbi:MAG: hypothetical protein U9O64_07530 [Campylobacterota bacterium]|nr:hypothetical protein [Campylobacterota bacterium]